jgi:anti-sigma-K factor RskA
MISEELQDQAALYVLGRLDASEAAVFEESLSANAELQDLVRQLRDSVGAIAYAAPSVSPPAELRARILDQVSAAKMTALPIQKRSARISWVPWAIAAALTLFCGILVNDRARLQRDLTAARSADPLSGATVVPLATTPAATAPSKGTVVWRQNRQSGVIKLSNMPAPDPGKDYQLWVVDAEHKDPISAGIVRVNADGVAELRFKPVDAANHVKAFAISVEREGGVPKKEGPIVMVGSA